MSVLKMYFANDTLVSEAPTETDAIAFTLRADTEESGVVRLYAKCDTNFQATTVTVEGAGTHVARWELAEEIVVATEPTIWIAAGTGISLGTVTVTKKYFWARAKAVTGDTIGKDISVTLTLEGVGEAV